MPRPSVPRGETLFIDARQLGTMIDRVHRELTGYNDDGNLIPGSDIDQIASAYHAWRGDRDCQQEYEDVPGFCKAATVDKIRGHSYILTPGRYVGMAEAQEDEEPFEEKMERLTVELAAQMGQAAELDTRIWANLEELGYGLPAQ